MRITTETDRTGLRRRTVTGLGWAATQKLGTRVASLATFVVLGRLLDPTAFGLVAAAAVVVGLVNLLFEIGLSHYLVQQVKLGPRTVDTAFWSGLALSLVVAALVVAAAQPAARMLGDPRLSAVVVVMAGAVPLAALSTVPQALLRRSLQFDVIAKRSLIGITASAAVGITLAAFGAGVWALVAQTYAQNLASAVLFYGVGRWHPGWGWSRPEAVRMLRYGASMWGMSAVAYLRERGDELVIGLALGSGPLGVYAVAKRILMVLLDLLVGIVFQVLPAALAAAKTDPARVRRGYVRTLGAAAAVAAPFCLLLAGTAHVVVPAVFGAQWEEAASVARITAIGGLAFVLSVFDRGLYLALDEPLVELRTAAITAGGSLLLLGAAAPHGLLWVAAAWTTGAWLSWCWRLLVLRRRAGIRPGTVLGAVWAECTAAAITGLPLLVVVLAGPASGWWPAVTAAAMVAAYPVVLRRLAPRVMAEYREVAPARLWGRGSLGWPARWLLGTRA